jgi:hypothetical protein
VSKDDCDRLAAIVGDGKFKACTWRSPAKQFHSQGCTAKAITHRVAKFREAAAKLGLQDGAAVPATPASGKKRGRKNKTGEDEDGDETNGTPTKKPRTPKTKKSATTVEDDVQEDESAKKEEADGETEAAA